MQTVVLATDAEFKKELIRYFAIGAVFYVLAALVSVGFFHPDQHFQTLEFAHLKIDPGNENRMVWEYHSRIRPWTQPYAYLVVIQGLKAAGIDDPFIHDAVIRLTTGLIGMAALVLFCLSVAHWLPLRAQKRWLAIIFGLFWLFPFHNTRTSSETASSIFLLFALSALVLLRKNRAEDPPIQPALGPISGPMQFSATGLLLSGICMGLMFNTRYQMGFIIVAVTLWMLLIQKTPVRQVLLFLAIILATIAFGVLLDTEGYGEFEFVPWNYLRINLIEGRAASFGTDPWYFYILSSLIQPLGPVLLVAAVLFWRKYPKNVITWITLLFVLVHMAISHKEIRFLIPVIPLVLAGLIFVIPERWFLQSKSGNPFLGHARSIRWIFYFFATVNILALVITSVRPPRPEVSVHQFIQSIEPENFEFYSTGATPYLYYQSSPPGLEFYAPPKVTQHTMRSLSELPHVLENKSPIYFYYPNNKLPDSPTTRVIRENCRLIYQSYGPGWDNWNFGNWIARLATSSIFRCGPGLGHASSSRVPG
jgi:phosphatidylinositol glycan class B